MISQTLPALEHHQAVEDHRDDRARCGRAGAAAMDRTSHPHFSLKYHDGDQLKQDPQFAKIDRRGLRSWKTRSPCWSVPLRERQGCCLSRPRRHAVGHTVLAAQESVDTGRAIELAPI